MNDLKKIEYVVEGQLAYWYGTVKGLYDYKPQAKLVSVNDFNLAEYEKQHHQKQLQP